MTSRKQIIDIETLELWDSLKDCAEALGVSCPYLVQAINMKYRVGGGMGYTKEKHGHLLEYFSYWLRAYTVKDKAKYCRNKQFDFMEGKEDE